MMWYLWQMIKELFYDLLPWIYALLIVGVALAILSTAIGDTAMMSDIFLPLIGIILIAFIMVVWL